MARGGNRYTLPSRVPATLHTHSIIREGRRGSIIREGVEALLVAVARTLQVSSILQVASSRRFVGAGLNEGARNQAPVWIVAAQEATAQ